MTWKIFILVPKYSSKLQATKQCEPPGEMSAGKMSECLTQQPSSKWPWAVHKILQLLSEVEQTYLEDNTCTKRSGIIWMQSRVGLKKECLLLKKKNLVIKQMII